MKGGSQRTPPLSPPIRIGQSLKNNQSITYSEPQSPIHQFSKQNSSSYGAQIYLQSPTTTTTTSSSQLSHKYLMVCMEVQRLTKLSVKHQTMIFNLTQQIQIRITDSQSFREREVILQRELKRIQEDDKALLNSYHKLEQVLLQKNRLTGMLEQQLIMMRGKVNGMQRTGGRENSEDKNRIRQLEENLIFEKNKNLEMDRQYKEAVINLERAQARMNTKQGTERNLLLNSENRIKELQEQLRVYVAQKRLLEENQIRFSQQNKMVDQIKFMEIMREMDEMKIRNQELENQKRNVGATLQKDIDSLRNQARIKHQNQAQFVRQIEVLEGKLDKMNNLVGDRQKKISLINNQKSQLQYRLRTTLQQLKRTEQRSSKYILPQTCKICSHFQSQNKNLHFKIQRLQQLIKVQEKQYKLTIQKSQKEMKNLRQLFQSVNNLKGSNERVERLIEVSASKLMRTNSSKGFFSASTLM